jgi:hypothetical protein
VSCVIRALSCMGREHGRVPLEPCRGKRGRQNGCVSESLGPCRLIMLGSTLKGMGHCRCCCCCCRRKTRDRMRSPGWRGRAGQGHSFDWLVLTSGIRGVVRSS